MPISAALNANLAAYVVPINLDISRIGVDFIDKPNPVFTNSDVTDLGKMVMAGVTPPIANAVSFATGQRARAANPVREPVVNFVWNGVHSDGRRLISFQRGRPHKTKKERSDGEDGHHDQTSTGHEP